MAGSELKRDNCDRCGRTSDEWWPGKKGEVICQMCWEADSSKMWWETCLQMTTPKMPTQTDLMASPPAVRGWVMWASVELEALRNQH